MAYEESNGHVTDDVTTSRDPKGQTHDPNTLRVQYLKQLEMPFSNNCYIVCCEAVLSAILATSGLLL